MKSCRPRILALWLLVALLTAPVAFASGEEPAPSLAPAQADEEDEADEQEEEELTERMVITASRVEQRLQDVAAPLTVLTTENLTDTGAVSYADALRKIPGLNVVQFSARDINMSSRAATSSLAPGQLVLVDNRSIYQDFFGFVMWDFLPVDFDQIQQVEAIRGPGSAVWGANALNGVINIRTKGPADLDGGNITVGAGSYSTRYASAVWGDTSGNWGWRVAGSYYEQAAFDRPEGVFLPSGVFLPTFDDPGTEQPKLDGLVEYDLGKGGKLAFNVGSAKTSGLIHTGIGPFDIDKDTSFSHAKFEWTKGAYRATLFVNDLDGDAINLLNGIDFSFETRTTNLDFVGSALFSKNLRLVYGLNARTNKFDLSIAPLDNKRDEYGVFGELEWILGKWRLNLGTRVDNYPDTIDTVASPRFGVIYEFSPGQSLRASANQAYRAPSLVNNYLDTVIETTINVGDICDALGPFRGAVPQCAAVPPGSPVPYTFPTDAVGNVDLKEESIRMIDFGYMGIWKNVTFSASIYESNTEDVIDFFPSEVYTAADPPPDWYFGGLPSPPFPDFLGLLDLPSQFTYRNVAEVRQRGLDLALDWQVTPVWSTFVNYSYMDDPKVSQVEGDETFGINIPASNRFNIGFGYGGRRVRASFSANYTSRAFWSDVLDARFWGETDPYLMLNGNLSFDLVLDKLILTIKGTNLADQEIQQHIFGDFIGRRIITQLQYRF